MRLERALNPKPKTEVISVDITEANLAAYVAPPVELLHSRGITPAAAELYGILYDSRKECWILPIRDLSGKLLGWQEKGAKGRYFRNYPAGIQKSHSLFGYQQYTGGTMVVVESPLDVARMASVGLLGGVSTYGTAVSKDQMSAIKGAERVIVAMDNDEAGRQAAQDFLKKSVDMWFECWFFDYASSGIKDVGGMSKAEIVYGIENAKHALHGEKALS
jgi:DNA primase